MQVLIDNFDGLGKLDYTGAVQFGKGATITRILNKPTMCRLPVVLGGGLQRPGAGARVQIADSSGRSLFTGYVAGNPGVTAAGEGTSGYVETSVVTAISDESMLDVGVSITRTTLLGRTVQQNWNVLNSASGGAGLSIALSEQLGNASRVQVEPGSRWSEAAGALAGSTRSVYRVLDGEVEVSPVGQVAHTILGSDAGLRFKSVNQTDLHWLAQDVTVLGREEPRAYVTEIFQGDGVTASFALTEKPFAPSAQQRIEVSDLFQGTSVNPQLWKVSDAGGHIALTAGGLSCTGGSGRDGESSVALLEQIELGGSIVVEAGGVQISPGSVGTILGLYPGAIQTNACSAGFAVSSSADGLSVSPVVNGVAAGSACRVSVGRLYTLRLRVFAPEIERVRQTYFYLGSEGTAALGGESVPSVGWLQFEVQDVTSGTPSAPNVLYAGLLAAMPPSCVLSLLSSGTLVCSIKTIRCMQSEPLWVGSGANSTAASALTLGAAVDGAACHLSSIGTLDFYPGSVPAEGSYIAVLYRSSGRAAARCAVESTSGASQPISLWAGTVTHPPAWSSVDCEYAAKALIGMRSGNKAGWQGTYSVEKVEGGEGFWPGDTISLGASVNSEVPHVSVRSVEATLMGGAPSVVAYTIQFANDWVESLSLQLSSTIPPGAALPQAVTEFDTALQSLSGLSVLGVTGSVLDVAAGVEAPINGGFEVRRRDDTFGSGSDSDLVLRTATSNFSIPRAAAREQYFIRMFDGANPPNYSLFSAAVFINVPQ